MNRKRINDIEVRTIENYNGEYTTEIIRWYKNPYYGKQDEYVKVEEDGRVYYKPHSGSRCIISEGCFRNPESCYVLAFVECCNDEEPDITSVGARPFALTGSDREDFLQIVKYVFETYGCEFEN